MYELARVPAGQDATNDSYVKELSDTIGAVGGVSTVVTRSSELVWPPLFIAVTTSV
jgi:hypothetical protein